ncbi:hypothetical protein BG004_006375 [Podila humilis]|nr:hypothetical protein BG004_006375 [Podila humilis]
MSIEEAKQEMVVLGMRTKSGVSYDRFKQLTQQDLLQFLDLDTVKSCIDAGLMRDSPAGLAPTERGMAVADELVVRLLP